MPVFSSVPILGKIVDSIGTWIDQAVEDKDLANRLKNEFQITWVLKNAERIQAELNAQAQTLTAEIKGESWLQRNWRPILMLTFTYIVAHNYILVPLFSLPSVEIPPAMWSLLEVGVGGYVVGRSVEKIIPSVSAALKGDKK